MNSQLTIATQILAVLAHHQDDRPVTSETLAQGFGTNPVVIRRILARLKAANLIASRSGSGGGSVLARPADQISLRDAYLTVTDSAPMRLTRAPKNCPQGESLAPIIADYLNEIHQESEQVLRDKLAAVSILDLTQVIANRLNNPDKE